MASTAGVAQMNITIAGATFDHHLYDSRGDVLYLNVGKPQREAGGLATDEGHGIHFDADGAVIGMTLVNVRWLLERDGELTLTWPQEYGPQTMALESVPPAALEPMLTITA
jgi:uncharacterized protein YuzE